MKINKSSGNTVNNVKAYLPIEFLHAVSVHLKSNGEIRLKPVESYYRCLR